jgi:hypothetical protein
LRLLGRPGKLGRGHFASFGYVTKGKTKQVTTTVNVDTTPKACYCTIQKAGEALVTGFDRVSGGKAPRDKSTSQAMVNVQLTSTPQATGFKVYYLPWRHDALSLMEPRSTARCLRDRLETEPAKRVS